MSKLILTFIKKISDAAADSAKMEVESEKKLDESVSILDPGTKEMTSNLVIEEPSEGAVMDRALFIFPEFPLSGSIGKLLVGPFKPEDDGGTHIESGMFLNPQFVVQFGNFFVQYKQPPGLGAHRVGIEKHGIRFRHVNPAGVQEELDQVIGIHEMPHLRNFLESVL